MILQLQKLDGGSLGKSLWPTIETFERLEDLEDYLQYPTTIFSPVSILRVYSDGTLLKKMFHDGTSCVDARDVMKDHCWDYSADSRNFAEHLDYLTAFFTCEKAPWLIWAVAPYLDYKILMTIVRRCILEQLGTRNLRVNQIQPTLQAIDRWIRGEIHSYEVECVANTMLINTAETYENLMSQAVHFLAMGAKNERPCTYLVNSMFSLCAASARSSTMDAYDGSLFEWAQKLKEYISIHDVAIGVMYKHGSI